MRKTKKIKTEQGEIVVNELTIAELKNSIEEIEKQQQPHIVDFMFDNMPSAVIAKSIDVEIDELEQFTQTDLVHIEEAVVELNPLAQKMFTKLTSILETMNSKTQ